MKSILTLHTILPHNKIYKAYKEDIMEKQEKKLNIFEKYLTLWVLLCIGAGIIIGKFVPQIAVTLDSMSVFQVSIPIAVCLFFMMYPIMVKIDFSEVINAGKTPKPVLMTLVINCAIKPFTMYLIATFFWALYLRILFPVQK